MPTDSFSSRLLSQTSLPPQALASQRGIVSFQIVLVVLLVGLLLACGMSLRWYLADRDMLQVSAGLERWADSDYLVSLEEWQGLEAQSRRALKLRPAEADYHRRRAMVLERRNRIDPDSLGSTAQLPPRQAQLQEALAAYQEAVRLRPAWPFGWLDVARMHFLLGDLDEEFRYALHRAFILGPNEQVVQREGARLSLLAWRAISSDVGLVVAALQNIQRGLGNPVAARQQVALLRELGVLEAICPRMDPEALTPFAQRACGLEQSGE